MTTTLWLVRHGQTDWNVEGRYQGQADVPLNAAGLQQARALAAEIAGENFDAIYCSDLERARVTAEIIARPLHLPVQIDVRLREINQGQWEGKYYLNLMIQYPDEMQARRIDPIHFRPPDGETAAEVAARMAQAADEIAATHPQGRVVIVSHALAIAALFCQANALPLQAVYDHLPSNARPVVIAWPPLPNGHNNPVSRVTTH